jgi:hypothetical protein
VALAVAALVGSLRGEWLPGAVADLGRDGAAWMVVALVATALAWLVGHSDPEPPTATSELLDYERLPIPYGVLQGYDGPGQTLRELALTRARLLIFLSPGCGACERTAVRIDEWAAALGEPVGVHAVYTAPLEALPAPPHDRGLSFHEPEQNVTRAFGMLTTPSAVLLGADGLLAGGPVTGESAVAEMVEDLRAELFGERADAVS